MVDSRSKTSSSRTRKLGDIPLPVAKVVQEAALRLSRVEAERLIEREVGRLNAELRVEHEEGAAHGRDDRPGVFERLAEQFSGDA